MPDGLILLAAILCAVAGMGWLALAMPVDRHFRAVRLHLDAHGHRGRAQPVLVEVAQRLVEQHGRRLSVFSDFLSFRRHSTGGGAGTLEAVTASFTHPHAA